MKKHKLFLPFLSVFTLFSPKAQSLEISGWPISVFNNLAPGRSLGNDPVLGRLACPPVSRFNLETQRSEGLLFKNVAVDAQGVGSKWTYEMRSGIYWWSGEPVQSIDFERYIADNLARILDEKGLGLWSLPPFRLETSLQHLTIHWAKKPLFGPFIFNGESFFRLKSNKAVAFECVGTYVLMDVKEDKFILKASEKYGVSKPQEITVAANVLKGSDLSFLAPLEMGEASCARPVDQAWVTGVAWNPKLVPKNLRSLLTSAIPRGGLLRQGALRLGELATTLIPKHHFGYESTIALRKFDLEYVANSLPGVLAAEKLTQPLTLYIESPLKESIAQKVIEDCFFAVNISVHFVLPGNIASEKLHGRLVSFIADSEMNFLEELHSKAKQGPLWSPDSNDLNQALEHYAISITQPLPDLTLLKRVHRLLYDLEPVSVFFHHQSCLQSKKPIEMGKLKLNHPDWFKILIRTL